MLDIIQDRVSSPHFPIIIFLLALFKDLILDPIVFVSTILLPPLGWLLGIFVSITVGGVLLTWRFVKTNGSIEKMATTVLGVIIALIIGTIPVARFVIPEYTILILLIYFLERRAVKKKRNSVVATA